MEQKKLSELTDQELLQEAKKMRAADITNAFFIGLLIGIIVFGVVKSGFGFFMIIPLFLIYKLVKRPEYRKKELQALLKERNLK